MNNIKYTKEDDNYEIDWSTMRQTEQGTWMVCAKPKPQKIQINIEVQK